MLEDRNSRNPSEALADLGRRLKLHPNRRPSLVTFNPQKSPRLTQPHRRRQPCQLKQGIDQPIRQRLSPEPPNIPAPNQQFPKLLPKLITKRTTQCSRRVPVTLGRSQLRHNRPRSRSCANPRWLWSGLLHRNDSGRTLLSDQRSPIRCGRLHAGQQLR